ncbi:hypothetical protein ACJIZ3_019833 [Penstemon smallii]|uniref:Uncharacterized protein n=1 Tax=Penstemon smallii TaxID=265156 RepID=A0ABD3T319_9LAMI
MFLDRSDVSLIPRLTLSYEENQELYLKKMEKWMTDNNDKSEIYRCLMTGLGSGPVIIEDRPAPRSVDEGQETTIYEIHVPNTSPTQCNAPQTTPPVETPPAWAVQLLQEVKKNEQTLEQVLEEL